MDNQLAELRKRASEVLENEPMSLHTTFRIGGPADYYVTADSAKEILDVISWCRSREIPYFILGNGSNLLVSDGGFRGAVIRTGKHMQGCEVSDDRISAGSGVLLSRVAAAARDHSLTGLEFASGIPGTLGGAIVMNAGAYGGEMKDVLVSVAVLDPEEKEIEKAIRKLPVSELELGYRTSRIRREGWIVLSAEMKLEKGDPEAISGRMEELRGKRAEKQPLEYPSAGSTFKRPVGYFAGKLIQDAGLRGYRVGGAQVSEKHCGFVINTGGASAEDVVRLIRHVQKAVFSQSGVQLEPEIRFLGFGGEAACHFPEM